MALCLEVRGLRASAVEPGRGAVQARGPRGGRGEAVDHYCATGGEQASGIRGAITFGLASAVEHEYVMGAVLFDALPVAVEDRHVGAAPEDLRGDAGSVRVPFDTGQSGS